MIFTHKLYDAWAHGHKRVTRRPMRDKNGREIKPPKVGDLLPMQRGYTKATGYAWVLSVSIICDFRGVVTPDEARREGFESPEAFRALWESIYGPDPIDVYRIELSGPVSATNQEGR